MNRSITSRISMRVSMFLIVLIMGGVGVFLALATGQTYQRLALDNQREAFRDLAEIDIGFVLARTIKYTTELGLSIQADPHFRQAFRERERAQISAQLDEQFDRFFVTTDILKLEKIFAFDKAFELIAQTSGGARWLGNGQAGCPRLLERTRGREGGERLKPVSERCLLDGHPLVSVLVPIGSLRLEGYLLIDIDPTPNLIEAEDELGMPLKLALSGAPPVYVSDRWPETGAGDGRLIWDYILRDGDSTPIYTFTFASDISPFYDKLARTRDLMFAVAAIATLVVAFFMLLLLQKTMIEPLAALTRQLRLVREDKVHLGKPVPVGGNNEIAELARGFNEMSSELNALYDTLEHMAFTDALTGLPNRALFYDRLEHAIRLARREGSGFALFMLDLDQFKYINDTLGHPVGDRLLEEVASRLQHSMRESDTVARLGGDEFAVLLPGMGRRSDSVIIAQKILSTIAEPVVIDGHELRVSVSIGIVFCPSDGDGSKQLMQRADVAMYQAKRNRCGFVFYEAELDRHNMLQLNMETELVSAIDNGDLELYYQPVLDMKQRRTIAVEALIRWNHPRRGLIMPDRFMPLVEQSSLIHTVTEWVLDTALCECAAWQARGHQVAVAVNLSVRSLEDLRIVDMVDGALLKWGVDARWLVLELTEGAVMADPDRAMQVLGKLNEIGVRIAVDDFGSGYSSLAYLKRLPVDEIKIDKTFVINMDRDSSDAVIARATIDLAHNMGLTVVAEGVESQAGWRMLEDLDCDAAQGFYISRPLGRDELACWLEKAGSADGSTKKMA